MIAKLYLYFSIAYEIYDLKQKKICRHSIMAERMFPAFYVFFYDSFLLWIIFTSKRLKSE